MSNPSPKRSPYSFTLRRALWWFVVLSVVFAGARWVYVRIYFQNWAVGELKTLGVTTFDSGHYIPMSRGGPGYTGDMQDRTPYAVVAAQIHVPFANDEDAKRVNQLLRLLPYLEDVSAHGPMHKGHWHDEQHFADEHFAVAIEGLPFSSVDFHTTLIGGRTVEVLHTSRTLRGIVAYPRVLSPAELALVCENPNLRRLIMDRDGLTAEHLQVLAKAKQLTYLFLRQPHVEGLQGLANLTGCELHITSTEFADEDLFLVAKLPNLHGLGLNFNERITDAGVQSLRATVSLRTLSLQEAPNVTDAGIVPLKDLPQLVDVNLDHTQVTEEGVIAFCGTKRFNRVRVWQGLDIQRLRAACPNANILRGADEKPQTKRFQQKTPAPPDDDEYLQ